jgi:hypothetical protein
MFWKKNNGAGRDKCENGRAATLKPGEVPEAPTPDVESRDLSFYGKSVFVKLRSFNPVERVKDFIQDAYGY